MVIFIKCVYNIFATFYYYYFIPVFRLIIIRYARIEIYLSLKSRNFFLENYKFYRKFDSKYGRFIRVFVFLNADSIVIAKTCVSKALSGRRRVVK